MVVGGDRNVSGALLTVITGSHYLSLTLLPAQ
jgi:hypothetical protein